MLLNIQIIVIIKSYYSFKMEEIDMVVKARTERMKTSHMYSGIQKPGFFAASSKHPEDDQKCQPMSEADIYIYIYIYIYNFFLIVACYVIIILKSHLNVSFDLCGQYLQYLIDNFS